MLIWTECKGLTKAFSMALLHRRMRPGGGAGEDEIGGPVLQFDDVSVTYKGAAAPRHALRDVNLVVAKNRLTILMGPSGSGKSTLLNVAGGLEAPTKGTVHLFGNSLHGMAPEARTALRLTRVGYVFQEYNLIQPLTALENVALPLELTGVGRSDAKRRALAALSQVGLEHVTEQLPGTLSGGEQQRTAIARALVIPRGLLLGDEITGALDTANTRQVVGLLRQLVSHGEATCLLATHDPEIASAGDRIVELRDGRVVSDSGAN